MPTLQFHDGTLLLSPRSQAELGNELLLSGDSPALPSIAPRWVWDPRCGAWRCDALCYRTVREQFDALRVSLDDRVPRWRNVGWPKRNVHPLRPHQRAAVAAWMKERRGVVVMPTGAGKTELALQIMARTGVATLVVAPVRDLMYQWHRRILHSLGLDSGVIGDGLYRLAPVAVTTYDSACIHAPRLSNRFGLVIFDECHHLPGPLRGDAARMSAAPLRLGLTATPDRGDGRRARLTSLVGPIVFDLPISAVKGNVLADYSVVRIPVELSPREQARYDRLARTVRNYVAWRQKSAPGFHWRNLCAESADTPRARAALGAYFAKKSIEDRAAGKLRVLEDLFRLHRGEICLVFVGSNAMARDVSRRFLIPCLLSHCRKRERREILQGLADGTYPALVANRVRMKEWTCHRPKWRSSLAAARPPGKPRNGWDACCEKRARPRRRSTKLSAPAQARNNPRDAGVAAKPSNACRGGGARHMSAA